MIQLGQRKKSGGLGNGKHIQRQSPQNTQGKENNAGTACRIRGSFPAGSFKVGNEQLPGRFSTPENRGETGGFNRRTVRT